MELTTTLFNFSIKSAGVGLLIIFSGWLIVILLHGFKKGPFNIRQAGPFTRAGFGITMLGIVAVVIALLSAMASGVLWFWHIISNTLSPGRLALYSVIIGVSPLILSISGTLLAKLSGGTVDASGSHNCIVRGVDLGGLVYTLFLSYWLMLFTGGLMILGLILSFVRAVF